MTKELKVAYPILLKYFTHLSLGNMNLILDTYFLNLCEIILNIDNWRNCCETALIQILLNLCQHWFRQNGPCRQAASYYLSQRCRSSMTPYDVTKAQWVKPTETVRSCMIWQWVLIEDNHVLAVPSLQMEIFPVTKELKIVTPGTALST